VIIEVDIRQIEKISEPPKQETVEVEQEMEIERLDVAVDIQVEVDDVPTVDAPMQNVVMPNIITIAPSDSALVLPGAMPFRSGDARKKRLGKTGGSQKSERGVDKGLRWLRDHQNPDGSWGDEAKGKAFLTGAALLAFLAHGETPQSQEYGACILKAIKKLIEMVNTRGGNGLVKDDANAYGHAVVAYALSEAYALTRIPMVEVAMNTMTETLVKGQNNLGGYNYSHNNGLSAADPKDPKKVSGVPRYDLSVTGWHYQALKAAFAAGCTTPGLEKAIEKSIKGMKDVMYCEGTGGFRYSNENRTAGASPTMSAVGALCLQLFGEGKSREAKTSVTWLESTANGGLMKCDWKNIDSYAGSKEWPLYQWYYQTQAIFQAYDGTGPVWKEWNNQFQTALIKEQESDGHWESVREKYSKAKQDAHGESTHSLGSKLNMDIYATALCVLMLEVYYRYLPTFKVVSGPATPGADGGSSEKTEDTTGLIIK
ncbi:MAG: terpene cyclase/mutase family protein, partial [Rectinemataceae bacterium]|nr:terpene cyclase/mutase family protein [Rectinemataceae bacterium]